MNDNASTIERFYAAFSKRDAAAMIACYAPNVRFEDPAFGALEGERAKAMWQMLCERASDLRVEYRDVKAEGSTGSAHWEAWYSFSATGRSVHNIIDASFEFDPASGLITRHTDRFDFHRWAGLALGAHMRFLTYLPPVKRAIGNKARDGLEKFIAKRASKG